LWTWHWGFLGNDWYGLVMEIPLDLWWHVTLNDLEYLAGCFTLWMEILVSKPPHSLCFLSQMDSTSAVGWLQKSSFDDWEPLHLEITRAMATLIMDLNSCLYSQWLKRTLNEVADSLSHDDHLSVMELLTLLHSTIPKQVPEGFKLCPLPPIIEPSHYHSRPPHGHY
jgi:hypothetical protein